MAVLPRIRRLLAVAALVALVAVPAASGAQFNVAALNGSFAGADGWTASSACAPLCTVTNMVDPGPGANDPGSATVVYTTLGGLLGGLATGTSTWTSPSFTWSGPTPAAATLAYARKAAVTALLAAGGTVSSRLQLRDTTTGAVALLGSETIPSAEASFVTHTLAVDPSLLLQGHAYRVLITTNLSAAALLSGIRVSYDDVALNGVAPRTAGTGDAGTGTQGPEATGPATPGGHAAATPLSLNAPRVLRFVPGRSVTLRVRALREGKAAAGVRLTLRYSGKVRRAVTRRDGSASLRLTQHSRTAVRVTIEAEGASTATWVRATPAAAA